MKPWLKITIGIASTLFALIFFALLISYFLLKQSLPDYSGTESVSLLKKEVKIFRDNFAIPHIYAENDDDLYYALGYVHAQERLFQMDLTRRAGQGKLSEVLGTKTISFDKLFRTIGLNELVEKIFEQYDETTKSMLVSYSNGVNEFIKNKSSKFTIEFDVLGYEPELWKPEHSLLITKLMAWELNISWWSDIAFSHLIQKLGSEKVKDIIPSFEENAPTIIPDKLKELASIPLDFINVDREFRKFSGAVGTHIGSNNWVVNGSRSSSGKPIIANDPHLSFAVPGKWYVASLRSPNTSIDGFTLAGVPGVVIGKNENISWVLTNVMADDADFYVEKFDSLKENYFYNNEWQPLDIIVDTINVKDTSDVIYTIRRNHRGPIVSDVHNYRKLFPNEEQNKADISMRWTALEVSFELFAYRKINHAKNWIEFNDGVKDFIAPGQNFVYADDKGNIGYRAGVKLPIRNNNSTSFVFDGTKVESDWTGFVPFGENPNLYNPPQGYIASANNKTIKDYPYHISNVWEPPSRIKRISELLGGKEIHSKEDFKKYQMDFNSHYAKKIVPYITSAFQEYNVTDKNLNTSLDILQTWDYTFEANDQIPTVYSVFYQYLLKNIFEDEMGEQLFREYIFVANVPYRTVPVLLKENKSNWFDDINTKVTESRDDIIRKSLREAIDYLELEIDKDIAYWQWGKLHKVLFKHFFHGQNAMLDKLLDVGPFEIGGDGTTVFNTEYSFQKSYDNKLGPSMRYIYDFAEPEKFEMILPNGQSGHFMSEHYKDMTEMWLTGKYIEVNTNKEFVQNSNFDLLKLIPVK